LNYLQPKKGHSFMINPNLLAARTDEQIAFALRQLYSRYGYTHYRMSKFEE